MIELKQKRIYNKSYLDELLKRDKAILIGNYDKLSSIIIIHLRCYCNNEFKKKFSDIALYGGAFCKECVIKNKYKKIKATNMIKYGVENVSQSDDIKKKKEETYIEHYGMHPKKTQEVQDKYINTCQERYGCNNTSQVQEVKDKIKKVFDEKYGGHPMFDDEIKQRVKDTNMERYGVEVPFQSEEVKQKTKQTLLYNFGVEHPMQSIEIQEKSQQNSKKYKNYTMPSGIVRKVQGYETIALDILVKEYTEEQIITDRKDIPRINYKNNNQNKYYFPDIYIPTKNLIIEVKSNWTYKNDLEVNKLKEEATKKSEYNFEFWIFDSKGNKIDKSILE